MSKFIIALLFATFTTVACHAAQSQSSTIFEIRSGYDATVLAPAAAYANLPLCATGTSITIVKPCADAKVLKDVSMANHTALIALDAAEGVVRGAKQGNADEAISAAKAAVDAATKILAQYNIH